MARYLTGIQSTGRPHLGNILGAILPGIQFSKQESNECFYFIADLHSLTTIKDAKERQEYVYATAAAWLACGFDTKKNIFYRQSKIPQVCELLWYLSCFTPYPMLANAHSFKDKSDKLADVNAGLFTYPVLMAADILLYDAQFVPVGKDQLQHLEMTRDMASSFNHKLGETFVLPEASIQEDVKVVPGIDGQKMSKSYQNTIDIFLPDKQLRKNVMRIVTDSTPLEEPKNPDTCNVYKLYALLASEAEKEHMRSLYLGGNFGYGYAKQALFEMILTKFNDIRMAFNEYMANTELIEQHLQKGEQKAQIVAHQVLTRVKQQLGF